MYRLRLVVFFSYVVLIHGDGDVKSSLTFVIDDTGSMSDDIAQVKDNVKLVFDTVLHSNKTQIENFILVTFNDPYTKTLAVTKDEKVFKDALESINVHGGRDCPEYAMTGIETALEKSLPGSYFYVLTDASAKDYAKTEKVQSLAIKKQTQIVFLLTGRCHHSGSRDEGYQAYHTLAGATSGQVFHMETEEVGEVLNYISNTVENRKTKLVEAKFPPGDYKLNYTVDGGIKDTTVVVSGDSPRAKVFDSEGKEPFTEALVNISGVVVLKVPNPKPDEYTLELGSKSETSVSVLGETTVNFRHGFSILKPVSLNTTTTRPIEGEKSYLSIQLLTSEDGIELKSIDIVDLRDKIIMGAPVIPVAEGSSFYTTKLPFVPPNHLFKIAINAYNHKNDKPIRRYSLTPIEPQKPDLEPVKALAPIAEIVGGSYVEVDLGTSLKLSCKVLGYPKPNIIWTHTTTDTVLKSENAMIEYPYEYVSIMEIDEVKENATYKCTASNTHGTTKNDATANVVVKLNYYFNVIESPKDTSIEYEKEGSVTCKVDANPPASLTWYMKGQVLYADDNLQISGDNLIIRRMEPKLNGLYTCEAQNAFNKSVINFKITTAGIEAPVIDKYITEVKTLKGSNVYINCSVIRGKPTPIYTWWYKSTVSTFFKKISVGSERVLLENVTPEQSGTYRCIVRNVAGRDHHAIDLGVEYAPVIKTDETKKYLKEGSYLKLKCMVDGIPTPRVRWFLNDNIVLASKAHRIYRDHSMKIKGSLENSGAYRCEAKNDRGEAVSKIQVDYYAPVNIVIPESSIIETQSNRDVTLRCQANGFPEPEIRWTFYSIDPDVTPKVLRTVDPQTLSIDNIQLKQDGFYTCTAWNFGDMANITYKVIVNAPPIIVNADKNVIHRAVLGDLVLRVPCKAIGNPKPTIFWSLRGFDIAKGTEWHDIEEDGTLVIKNVDLKSRGYFMCRAENKLGSDNKYFLVDVTRIPEEEKPSIVIKVKENEKVDVKCGVPHENVDRIRWYKNNKQIAEDTLILERVTVLDSGVYTCRVSNFSSSASASTEVIVGSAPQFQEDVELIIDFDEGSFVELDCANDAEPVARTQWWFNDKELDITDMIHYFRLEYSNMGDYTCVVSNELGSINRTFSIKPQGCMLNVIEDFEGYQPLMVTPRHHTLKTIGKHLHIPKHERLHLVCPETFTMFPGQEIIATCEENKDFNVEGNTYKFNELSCTSLMVPKIDRRGFRCAKGINSETVDVGYSIDEEGTFISIYQICIDKNVLEPIYTKHTLNRASANVKPRHSRWTNSALVPVNFEEMYDCNIQKRHISNLLRSSFHMEDRCCFSKRQLVSPKDVMPGLAQAATYSYLNVIPHWSTCNNQNWDDLENRVRSLTLSTSDVLLVWTGHSVREPLKLTTEYSETSINIKPQLVSTYLWKVVQDPTTRSSLAIVQVNVPDLKESEKEEYTLCTDICDSIEWLKDNSWHDVTRGYTYCCEIRDFEKAFDYKNFFSPSGDKILRSVSLISSSSLTV